MIQLKLTVEITLNVVRQLRATFNTTTRKVSITEAGTLYDQRCRQLLDGLQDAEQAISGLHSPPNEGVWAIYPHNKHLLAKVRLLIDYLDAELSGQSHLTY